MSLTYTRSQIERLARTAGPDSPWHKVLAEIKRSKRPRKPKVQVPPSLGRTLMLVVPMPPSLTNSGRGRSRHYRSVTRAKHQYWKQLDERVVLGDLPSLYAPIGRARLASTMYLGAQMDADNAMARHKWVLDWLQNNGYLHNDKLIEWTAVPKQVVKRGQEYRLELEFREP